MGLREYFQAEFAEHRAVLASTEGDLSEPFEALVVACVASVNRGGKLLFFGNGGSAADAQHLAAELTVRYKRTRPAISAIALAADSSALTAAGNDLGFDQIFARQIEALGRSHDVAIAISTSGVSPNIIAAVKKARSMGLVTAGLSGKGGGKLPGLVDHLLIVPSQTTARVQEMHILLGQMLCGAIESEIGLT